MKSSLPLWLPKQPLALLPAADLSPVKYQIKTFVVSAQAKIEIRKGSVLHIEASAKIPFKSPFSYQCDVDLGSVTVGEGAFEFTKFRESHGDEWRIGTASSQGLRIDDGQLVGVPQGLRTLVALAQAPYVLRGAGDFEQAYLGLLVGRHPHLVRFTRTSAGRYKIAALGLKHDDVIDDPSRLDWSRAHGAEIQVRDGWIDEIRVAIPLMGAVTITRQK